MQFSTLETLIKALTKNTNITVCICDVSGILSKKIFNIDNKYRMHSSSFCSLAKTTAKGYDTCISCKTGLNKKADELKSGFCNTCPFGLTEIIMPVVIDSATKCIIYIGNLTDNKEKSCSILASTCRKTGSPYEKMSPLFENSEKIEDIDYYYNLAEIIASYITLADEKTLSENSSIHWAVVSTQNYIEENYSDNITLKDCANLYFMNEKYLGRIFKNQLGKTFHEYLTDKRLSRALLLLKGSDKSITDIALETGFSDVSYFNRIFKKHFSVTPGEYKKL